MPLGSSLSKLMLPWKFGYKSPKFLDELGQVLARRELQKTSGGYVVSACFVFQEVYQ